MNTASIQRMFSRARDLRYMGTYDEDAIKAYADCYNAAYQSYASVARLCLHEAGLVYCHKGDFAQAIHFIQHARYEAEQAGDTLLAAVTLFDESTIVEDLGDIIRAKELLKKSILLFSRTTDKSGYAMALVKLGEYELVSSLSVSSYQDALEFLSHARTHILWGMHLLDLESHFMANALRKLAMVAQQEKIIAIGWAEVILAEIEKNNGPLLDLKLKEEKAKLEKIK